MTMTATKTEQQKYTPMTADQLTPALLEEALAQAKRYDRNFANKDGAEAIPVPARTCRLLGLAIINLHKKAYGAPTEAPQEKGYMASTAAPKKPKAKKTAKAGKEKKGKKVVPVKVKRTGASVEVSGPPLSLEQLKAYDAVSALLAEKKVVTTRLVAERGGWGSHNTGARHIKNLIDLGYLRKVGKQQVIALTELRP